MKIYHLLFAFLVFNSCQSDKEEAKIISPEKNNKKNSTSYNPADGLAEGINITKYPGGQTKMKGEVLQGKRHGLWTTWRQNGMKWSESTYNLGVLEGKTVSYHENGQVNYIGYYKNDKKDGKWIFFDEEGAQIKEEVFK